uniref:Uncharacterized protein n=1 Tax=Zea mays TaxID=4577 RepID=B4FP88_MAIZE|nr:unknown [Zea mays]
MPSSPTQMKPCGDDRHLL